MACSPALGSRWCSLRWQKSWTLTWGNIWTAIYSLRREDAQRLGFDTAARWRALLRSQAGVLAQGLKIPPTHLKWYAAFHNEGHHPHVHLIAYSTKPGEGFLTKQGMDIIRSALAQEIFR